MVLVPPNVPLERPSSLFRPTSIFLKPVTRTTAPPQPPHLPAIAFSPQLPQTITNTIIKQSLLPATINHILIIIIQTPPKLPKSPPTRRLCQPLVMRGGARDDEAGEVLAGLGGGEEGGAAAVHVGVEGGVAVVEEGVGGGV